LERIDWTRTVDIFPQQMDLNKLSLENVDIVKISRLGIRVQV